MSVQSAGEGTGSTFIMEVPLIVPPSDNFGMPLARAMSKGTVDVLPSYSKECLIDEEECSPEAIRRAGSVVPCDTSDLHMVQSKRASDIMLPSTTSLLNVLVVDDVSLNRKMLCRSIVGNFNHIAQANDGLEALRYVVKSSRKPDIILMDFVMPNMDGPTATRELRALGYRGMIIGVTGNALPADVDIFLKAGATCVLTKPFRPEELYAAIAGK